MISSVTDHIDARSERIANGVVESINKFDTMVAILAYNEEMAIGSVALRCKKYAGLVVVIDDGSNDHTAEVARLAGAEVISHKTNSGYGAAIRTCFNVARKLGSCTMVIIDGDGQHNPDDIPMLVAEMNKTGADIVIGSKFINGNGKSQYIPAYRKMGMKVLDTAVSLSSGMNISDSQSGFRAYSRQAISEIDIDDNGMGAGSEILIKAAKKRLKISEVPIKIRYDIKDTSSINPVIHGLGVLYSIVMLSMGNKPILLYGVSGIALILLSFYLALGITAALPSVPALAIIILAISGTLSIFIGLMLSTIQHMAERLPGYR